MDNPIRNRYDFVILFDVENGNPNGDPDAGNMPRIDPETGHGLVTDVCIKRKIRNYVQTWRADSDKHLIYIRENTTLNANDLVAGDANGTREQLLQLQKTKNKKDQVAQGNALIKKYPDIDTIYRNKMCSTFYDIRTFGAVMTTFVKGALNCGQVRGPVQLGFARSIDPIVSQNITLTRVAITTEADAEKKETEMGNKYIIPYALYRMEGFVSANLAQRVTGFSEDDLRLLWEAIQNMFEDDRSAARGKMSTKALIVFKHESDKGNAPAYQLFDMVQVKRKDSVEVARAFSDYEVILPENLPEGVTMQVM